MIRARAWSDRSVGGSRSCRPEVIMCVVTCRSVSACVSRCTPAPRCVWLCPHRPDAGRLRRRDGSAGRFVRNSTGCARSSRRSATRTARGWRRSKPSWPPRRAGRRRRRLQAAAATAPPAAAAAPDAQVPRARQAPAEPRVRCRCTATPRAMSKVFNPDMAVIGNFLGAAGREHGRPERRRSRCTKRKRPSRRSSIRTRAPISFSSFRRRASRSRKDSSR